MQTRTFGFHGMQGLGVTEELLAFQEVLCSMRELSTMPRDEQQMHG
jgi:hypothetical protein